MYKRLITRLFLRILKQACYDKKSAKLLRDQLLPANPDGMKRWQYALWLALREVQDGWIKNIK